MTNYTDPEDRLFLCVLLAAKKTLHLLHLQLLQLAGGSENQYGSWQIDSGVCEGVDTGCHTNTDWKALQVRIPTVFISQDIFLDIFTGYLWMSLVRCHLMVIPDSWLHWRSCPKYCLWKEYLREYLLQWPECICGLGGVMKILNSKV